MFVRTSSSARLAEIVEREGNFHAIDVRGVQQALHVFAQAENRGALRGVVAADAFEDAGAVADDVREHVNLRVVPGDEFPVVPDLFGLGRLIASLRSSA